MAIVTRIQPQGLARLEWSNPLTSGAQAVINAAQDINLVSGNPLVRAGSGFQKAITPAGKVNNFKTYYLETEKLPAIGTGDFVEFWYGYADSAGGRNADNNGFKALTGSDSLQFIIAQNSPANSIANWSFVNFYGAFVQSDEVLPMGVLVCIVVMRKQGQLQFWRDGAAHGASSPAMESKNSSTFILGGMYEDATYGPGSSKALLAGRISGSWTPEQIKSFCANPWQILKSPQNPLYVVATTGVNGAIGWLEQSDTAAISGSVKVTASASWTEANDTAALASTVGSAVTGSLGWTEQSDTAAISGTATATAAASWTETSDTAAISASARVAASTAWTEANDTASVSSSVTVNAAAGWTEASDTTAISAAIAAGQSATIAWTEQNDTSAVLATMRVNASIGWTEASDISAATIYPQEYYYTIMRQSRIDVRGGTLSALIARQSAMTDKNYQTTMMRSTPVYLSSAMRNATINVTGTFL